MANKLSTQNRQAFTSIDLLVVALVFATIAIIFILPAAQFNREQARMSACISNTRRINFAIHVYAADNNNFVPYAAWHLGLNDIPEGYPEFSVISYDDLLSDYLAMPMPKRAKFEFALREEYPYYLELFACPSDRVKRESNLWVRSYMVVRGADDEATVNPIDVLGISGDSFFQDGQKPISSRLTHLRDISGTLALSELQTSKNWAGGYDNEGARLRNPNYQYFDNYVATDIRGTGAVERLPHGAYSGTVGDPVNTVNGIFNYSFADGHSKMLGSWDTYNSDNPELNPIQNPYWNVGGAWSVLPDD